MRSLSRLPLLAAALVLPACMAEFPAASSAPARAAASAPRVGDGALPARIISGGPAAPPKDAEAAPPARIVSGPEPAPDTATAPAQIAQGGDARAEAEIARMINAWRADHGLPPASLSPSLGAVARAHARDLARQHPDRAGCNLHSWSAAGDWTPVCYTEDHKRAQEMWDKPEELTAYPGRGFEIAFRGPFGLILPQTAMAGWENSADHNAVILEQGPWKNIRWKAMGVGVDGGYAVVWFGRKPDPAG